MIIKQTPQRELKYVRFPLEMLDLDWVTNADAAIYSFMLNRYLFFKSIGNMYYENIPDIAKGSRQADATVKRSISKLAEHGYISIKKMKLLLGVSNLYEVFDIHKIYQNPELAHVNLNEEPW